MTSTPIIDESEEFLPGQAADLTQPQGNECLCCYVARLLAEFPCDGSLRHALHYRDVVAPRVKGLAKSLGRLGGYCDCEIFMNGYQIRGADEDEDDDDVEEASFEILSPCNTVHRGSVEPCENWVRIR